MSKSAWIIAAACCTLLIAAPGANGARAQSGANIYTCVDSSGRPQGADRLIAECLDREHRELAPSGFVRRQIGPALSEQERAAQAAERRKEIEARSLVQEDRRRGRAMTLRYPHQASHDAARAKAIEMVDSITAAIEQRIDELKKQRKELDAQMDLYKKNPDKIPTALRHELAAYEENMDEQRRFMADQLQEKQRVHQRFDTELALLRKIWEAQPQPQPQLPTLGTASPK
ncbi:phage tail tape measure protein [Verminephrobacter eiseniae]|uniref:DUF4124 domain-containing protein n=1 Tax=Verminephrobacter eiseniae (strain EF01-2) TaxID=391735 RepID=A1WIB8_VEREI|nr:hypothetical protein [Verminephrobacter eiseniae]ABM57375.1 conserved hypothetical protein [Verminephrobacter eiseniae EF01-2]MCW5283002.1 DUF4124 domain-containing protein [Verminephrobacter eiseniae]MCW5303317.1 DUF4124 domain-containing protein [Verminephrobacter eiseniae]MCW8178096.1 DUF4124 domain-containing protein [Verminephrobacter eiseniae]MCW8188710.1 DUF4124 domain-containing protein [Verminephrobacter eiseniae]